MSAMRSFLTHRRGDLALALAALSLFVAAGGPAEAAKLLDGARLKARSIAASKLKDNSIPGGKIRNGTIGSVDIANGRIQRRDIAPSVFAGLQPLLTDGSITNKLLGPGMVSTDKLATRAVTGAKIGSGAVSSTKLSGNAVTTQKIADGAVGTADLADGGVTSAKIADGAVATADLAAAGVGGAQLADDAVSAAKIARNAVTGGELDATGAPTLNFGLIDAGRCATQAVPVTGTDVGDDVILVTPGPGFSGSTATASVQSAGQFSVTVCNLTDSAADPDGASGAVYRWVAIQAA